MPSAGAPLRQATAEYGADPVASIVVDATDAPRGIFHTRLTIPVRTRRVTLAYPKWIPGEHGPTGPIVQLVGLRVAAGDRPLSWTRSGVDLYRFEVQVPAGASRIDVQFDYVSPPSPFGSGYGAAPNAIQLLIASGHQSRSYRLDYTGGERHPHLVRDPARQDLLSVILAPRATRQTNADGVASRRPLLAWPHRVGGNR